VRFRPERAIWRGQGRNFELHLLPSGWLFKQAVDIHVVDGGNVHRLQADNSLFQFGTLAGPPPEGKTMQFSGFRVNAPINRAKVFDEIAVFQGASYFRAVSRGQVYGLSARGLAIDTGEQKGEEFPFFRSFWIETPPKGARHVVVHALLDSISTTGVSIGFESGPTKSACTRRAFRRYAALRASRLGAAAPQPREWSTLRSRSWSRVRCRLTAMRTAKPLSRK
jgi:glucan biosynthesis protein